MTDSKGMDANDLLLVKRLSVGDTLLSVERAALRALLAERERLELLQYGPWEKLRQENERLRAVLECYAKGGIGPGLAAAALAQHEAAPEEER